MIPRECRRLAEVDFPIAEVSRHAVREKHIAEGLPSTLHLWWARRPLGACRAMLVALLLPDPCDSSCPEEFKVSARSILAQAWRSVGSGDNDLRAALLRFVGEFADWNRANDAVFSDAARSLVAAAYPDGSPLVADPFAGGGSLVHVSRLAAYPCASPPAPRFSRVDDRRG